MFLKETGDQQLPVLIQFQSPLRDCDRRMRPDFLKNKFPNPETRRICPSRQVRIQDWHQEKPGGWVAPSRFTRSPSSKAHRLWQHSAPVPVARRANATAHAHVPECFRPPRRRELCNLFPHFPASTPPPFRRFSPPASTGFDIWTTWHCSPPPLLTSLRSRTRPSRHSSTKNLRPATTVAANVNNVVGARRAVNEKMEWVGCGWEGGSPGEETIPPLLLVLLEGKTRWRQSQVADQCQQNSRHPKIIGRLLWQIKFQRLS